jgi:hypothetical protein
VYHLQFEILSQRRGCELLKRIALIFLMLITLSCISGENTAEDYLPLKEGNTKEYEVVVIDKSDNVIAKFNQITNVLSPREMDEKQVIPVKVENITILGKEISIYFYSKDNIGIYIYKYQSAKDEIPQSFPINALGDNLYMIINPIKTSSIFKGKSITIIIDSINESITVPAGSFKDCVKATQINTEYDVISTLWFCKDVGVVKCVETFPEGKKISQLIK